MNRSMPSPGGDPRLDNRRRRQERHLDRLAVIRIVARGRRRKKYVTRVETARYRELIIAVAKDLASRHRAHSRVD